MTKNLVAVVTVRKGSQRVKEKNFKPFCGKNLLEYKIEALKKVKKLDISIYWLKFIKTLETLEEQKNTTSW